MVIWIFYGFMDIWINGCFMDSSRWIYGYFMDLKFGRLWTGYRVQFLDEMEYGLDLD